VHDSKYKRLIQSFSTDQTIASASDDNRSHLVDVHAIDARIPLPDSAPTLS